MSEFNLVLCTCPDQDTARHIAKTLVELKLAACVNIIAGVQSCYQWQGEVVFDQEYQLVIKTLSSQLEALQAKVTSLHPYDIPEWLVLEITDGSQDYLNWIRSSLK